MRRAGKALCVAMAVAAFAPALAAAGPSGAMASKAGKASLETGLYKGETSQGFAFKFQIVKATSSRCVVPNPPKHPRGRYCFIPANDAKIDEPCSTGFTFHNYFLGLVTYVLTPAGTLTKTSHSYSPPDPRPVGTSKFSLTVRKNGRASGHLEQSSELFIPADPDHPGQCDSGKVTFSAEIP